MAEENGRQSFKTYRFKKTLETFKKKNYFSMMILAVKSVFIFKISVKRMPSRKQNVSNVQSGTTERFHGVVDNALHY